MAIIEQLVRDSDRLAMNLSIQEENTKNVLVILLGWTGAKKKHLSEYNDIYTSYSNRNNVNLTIKQYRTPLHMHFIKVQILNEMGNYRNSFGATSTVIIHSFSSGTMTLGAINDLIRKNKNNNNIYYSGIIFDSPNLASLSPYVGSKVMWSILSLYICNNILCKIIFFMIFIIFLPIIWIIIFLYSFVTCACDTYLFHHEKLLCSDTIQILFTPILVIGSNKDHLTPIKNSLSFINQRIDKTQEVISSMKENSDQDQKEEIGLLSSFDIQKYNQSFIKKSNKCCIFENSEHVKHYRMYPTEYQKEVDEFLNLCLDFNKQDFV